MAQYYAVLKKAIGSLQPNSSEARRGIYEKARGALVNQLKAIQPPLSTSEISRQRLELEEAIRKVEREALAAVPIQVVSPPPPPVSYEDDEFEPRPAEDIEDVEPVEGEYVEEEEDYAVEAKPYNPAFEEAEELEEPAQPQAPPPHPEPQPSAVLREAFGFEDERYSQRQPAAGREARSAPPRAERREPDAAPAWRPLSPAAVDPDLDGEEDLEVEEPIAAAHEDRRRRSVLDDAEPPGGRRRSILPAVILTAILLLSVGLVGFLWQQGLLTAATTAVTSLFDRGGSEAGDVAAADAGKDEDRIGQTALAPPPSNPNVRVIDTTEGNVPAPPQPPGNVTGAAPPTIGDLAAAPPANPSVSQLAPVQQDALLIEQSLTDGGQPVVTLGTVTWTYATDAVDGATVVADISIPNQSVRLQIRIHENKDVGVPASHLIEFTAADAASLPGGGLQQVLVPVMKDTPESVGQQLVGSSVPVTPTIYWIALTGAEPSRSTNLRLLGEQKLMDFPLVYSSGRRAFLTLEFGPAGEALVDQAILAWAAP